MTKPKLFLYVQHLLGIGHQMRAAALCRAALRKGFEVHYISGGFPEKLPDLGNAIFHQLPPVKTDNGNFSRLMGETGQIIDQEWWNHRTNILLSLFNQIKPDLILLEGFPFARRKFKEELIPLLNQAKEQAIPCCASLRDILVDPIKEKKRQFAIQISEDYLDYILIHGEKNFTPLENSFPGAELLQDKLVYTGYVDPNSFTNSSFLETSTQDPPTDIIISAGGGAAGSKIYITAIEAVSQMNESHLTWRFLIGPNCPETTKTEIAQKYEILPPHLKKTVTIEPARPDFRQLLNNCRISISQAGYNTVIDLLHSNCQSILIPYAEGGESEQSIRATLLEQNAHMTVIQENELETEKLILHINALQQKNISPNPTLFHANGAEYSADFLFKLLS